MFSAGKEEENKLLPHHEQLPLCESRLPYRQGRKLTAVKVYTVNNESSHLLIFGVPSLNLRRETRELLLNFGKLVKFYVTTDHPAEQFTETYYACFQRIQSARIAKRMLDTKNFYGGSLHVCYAPELETIQETKDKLLHRKRDVLFRLKNLQKGTLVQDDSKNFNNEMEHNFNVNNKEINYKDSISISQSIGESNEIINEVVLNEKIKLNMSENNIIYVNKRKRTNKKDNTIKKSKPSEKETRTSEVINKNCLDIVDCTSVDKNIVSNINEALNYKTFGNEVIKKVDSKPLNKIVFNFNKNKS